MRFLFILGCHRSGTTVLQQALNRHSSVVVPPETKFFSSFVGHSHACQRARLVRLNRDLGIKMRLPGHGILLANEASHFFRSMAAAYIERIGRTNVIYFGEKTPAHSGYLPEMRKIIPGAKFLWIYRDGRDVASSLRTVPWMSKSLAVNFLVWLFYARKQLQTARQRPQDVVFIRYENLAANPAHELARVAEFLELPFEPAMAFGYGNHEGILPWEYPWKRRALEPISSERVSAWRAELSSHEVDLLECLGSRVLSALGYPLRHHTTSRGVWRCFPRIVLDLAKFARELPFDELTRQLFGHALCPRGDWRPLQRKRWSRHPDVTLSRAGRIGDEG